MVAPLSNADGTSTRRNFTKTALRLRLLPRAPDTEYVSAIPVRWRSRVCLTINVDSRKYTARARWALQLYKKKPPQCDCCRVPPNFWTDHSWERIWQRRNTLCHFFFFDWSTRSGLKMLVQTEDTIEQMCSRKRRVPQSFRSARFNRLL